jgi:hypothetical protein
MGNPSRRASATGRTWATGDDTHHIERVQTGERVFDDGILLRLEIA